LLPTLAQALHQLAQAGHVIAVLLLESPAEEALQGAIEVAVLHQVLGHGAHQLVRVEGRKLLGAVPT
jgi:hypothetical protein